MELLRELSDLQHDRGWLSDEALHELSARRRVPLYRLQELVSFYPHFRRTPPPRITLQVCRDASCEIGGCEQALENLRQQLEAAGHQVSDAENAPGSDAPAGPADIEIVRTSCLGRCDSAPAVAVNDIPLAPVTLAETDPLRELLAQPNPHPADEPTAAPRRWQCDPYAGGDLAPYASLRQLRAQHTDFGTYCVETLEASGLRGMGGAGFPTGTKWKLVRGEPAAPKYVICNADESEPGTFKDRVILEELPHLVIEGMLSAALTIGAEHGIVFIRHEYTRERKSLERAVAAARAAGVLGDNAAGSGQAFEIEIFVSPGGYILGEETALLECLEDKRGEPRNKPPYPGTHGLWGKPTLINNVESFALATSILHHGADWWHAQGLGEFSGLKFLSISGDVAAPGVYEVPTGTTVAAAIELAGGMAEGRELLAFLPGGASSNFLPAAKQDTPLEFQAMRNAGSMLGTGAVLVVGSGRDLLELATGLVRFFRNESCGKCVPCRMGSSRAVSILEGIPAGTTSVEHVALLPLLGETLEQTSICGLGQVALNPILSLLQHFPDAALPPR